MAGGRGAIWTERATVALILACLGGALCLVVRVRVGRVPDELEPSPGRSARAEAPAVAATPAPVKVAPPVKKPAPEPPPPTEDPTAKAVEQLSTQTAQELEAAQQADARAQSLEAARASAIAETEAWKRRTMLVKKQVATLNAQAEALERGVSAIDAERDVLQRERDVLKAALSKASRRSGYSVLPYKGENGTWRRPIVIECSNGGAKLLPKGESFNTLDLSPRIHPRSSPIVRAVARELSHIQSADTPDGAPAVPYLVFLVRPNGIRPYYEARASLEPLGIAFGYELIEQRLVVDVPDYDDLSVWDGSMALDLPLESAPRKPQMAGGRDPAAEAGLGGLPGARPASRGGLNPVLASGEKLARSGDSGSPDAFLWPNHSGSTNQGGAKPGSDPWSEVLKPAPGGGAQSPAGSQPGLAANGTMPGGGSLPDLEPTGPVGGTAGSGGVGFPQSGGRAPRGGAFMPGGGAGGAGGAAIAPPSTFASEGGARSSPPASFGGSGDGAIPPPRPFGGMGDLSPGPKTASGTSQPAAGSPSAASGGNAEDVGSAGGTPPLPSPPQGPDLASGAQGSAGTPAGTNSGGGAGGSPPYAQGGTPPLPSPPQGPDLASGAQGSAGTPAGTNSGGGAGGSPPYAQGGRGGSADGSNPKAGSSGGATPGTVGISSPAGPQAAADNQFAPASAPPLESSSNQNPPASSASSSQDSLLNSLMGSVSSKSSQSGSSSMSSSTSSSSTSSAGMPLSSSSSSGSASMAGADSSNSNPPKDDFIPPPIAREKPTETAIEMPMEITVVCRKNSILLHPGAYVLSGEKLHERGINGEGALVDELRAIVKKRAVVDPLIHLKPSLKFLVETQGSATFWEARRQLLFTLPDWPMSFRVSGPQERSAVDAEAR